MRRATRGGYGPRERGERFRERGDLAESVIEDLRKLGNTVNAPGRIGSDRAVVIDLLSGLLVHRDRVRDNRAHSKEADQDGQYVEAALELPGPEGVAHQSSREVHAGRRTILAEALRLAAMGTASGLVGGGFT